jgi:glycosyltransferase involved in cell wall biosynthesis
LTSQKIELSIVVPCHNVEKFLQKTIGFLYSVLNVEEELILVENGSIDNSLVALKDFFAAKTSKNVKIIQSPKGLGVALRHGIEHAQGKTIIFMEDDLPFGLQELELARKFDVTGKYYILSKYHGNIRGLGLRKIQGLVFIFLRELILRLNVKDSQATFFGDTSIVKKLASTSRQEGFLVTLELIAMARKLGVDIHEIPCDSLSIPVRPTTVKIRDILQMFVGLFQIKQYIDEVNIEKV